MQTAILCFKDYKAIELESGITQKQNIGTHALLNGANDFNGRGGSDRVDLLAPYDCEVKAIASYDNTVFFESLGAIKTPSGTYDHCWFMCAHLLDSDLKILGLKVGKMFEQGEPCYTEGNKGIGSGYHIHFESGYGTFKEGETSPYYKSSDSFTWNGKKYAQYYPNCDGYECPITDMFHLKKDVDYSDSNILSIYDNWQYYTEEEPDSNLIKIAKEDGYEYMWSVDGNQYGDKYDITSANGFGDTKLTADGYEEILAVNGSIFYTYDSKHFANGLEKSRGTNNQDLSMACVTNYNNAMAIGCAYDGGLVFDKQSNIMKSLDLYYGAITGIGIMKDGAKCTYGQSEFASQYKVISGRTIIGTDKEGNFLSYSIKGTTGSTGLYGKEIYDICVANGFHNAICLDGGGSVWRRFKGNYGISTTRKVKNALLLYRRKTSISEVEKLKEEIASVEAKNKVLSNENEELNKQVDQLSLSYNGLKNKLDEIANICKS